MRFIVAIMLLSFSFFATAQDESTEKESPWAFESELGFIVKNGNTQSESLNFKQSAIYDLNPWRNTIKFEAANASSKQVNSTTGKKEKVRTSERYYLTEKIDYFMTEKSYAFFRATFEKDRFSGYEQQSSAILGYGRQFLDNDTFKLSSEVGVGGHSQELDENAADPEAGQTDNKTAYYLAEDFTWLISTSSKLGQDFNVEGFEGNYVARFNLYVQSQLANSLAMKVSYGMKYTDDVPAGTNHKDEVVTATLVYSF